MKFDLIAELEKLGQEVNDFTDGRINAGGCGVYAAAVALALAELGVAVECIVDSEYSAVSSVAEARNNLSNTNCPTLRDWEDAGLGFWHVGVRFRLNGEWYTHDSEATREGRFDCGDSLRFMAHEDGLTVAEAQDIANEPHGWNTCFDRDLIPDVRAMVRARIYSQPELPL